MKLKGLHMKKLIILFSLISSFAFASSTFKLNCNPCDQSNRQIKIEITHIDQYVDQAVVSEDDKIVQTFKVYPQLPDDPDARYTAYKGERGTFFTLKIYSSTIESRSTCNSTLQAPFLGDATERISCKVINW